MVSDLWTKLRSGVCLDKYIYNYWPLSSLILNIILDRTAETHKTVSLNQNTLNKFIYLFYFEGRNSKERPLHIIHNLNVDWKYICIDWKFFIYIRVWNMKLTHRLCPWIDEVYIIPVISERKLFQVHVGISQISIEWIRQSLEVNTPDSKLNLIFKAYLILFINQKLFHTF